MERRFFRNFISRVLLPLIGLLLLNAGGSCSPQQPEQPDEYRPLRIDNVVAHVKMAKSVAEQATGLMYRHSLSVDCGMLFVYETPKPLSFWMKNTFVPLSIAFIRSDGTISEILHMAPDDGRPDYLLPRYVSQEPVQYALEMARDWFATHGIRNGSRVHLADFASVSHE